MGEINGGIAIKFGKEVIGAYGESAGVSCPYCGTRNYPTARYNYGIQIRDCNICGNPFLIPYGYSKEVKNE